MTEQQPYHLVKKYPHFDLRSYPTHVVAEVKVNSTFDRAGNAAFRYLFNYISGKNTARRKLAMTAPVIQGTGSSEKLAMTAPVIQRGPVPGSDQAADFVVAFVLPDGITAETAPVPDSPEVTIREVPGALAAAVRFSGSSSADAFQRRLTALREALIVAGLKPVGEPRFARFDPPFKPWFLRHNEVVLDVEDLKKVL